MLIRKASVMRVFPEYQEEYKMRQDELWLETENELKNHGAHNYSIFLGENTSLLFAYVEIENEVKWSKCLKLTFVKNGGLI